jgi:hypothetical protein
LLIDPELGPGSRFDAFSCCELKSRSPHERSDMRETFEDPDVASLIRATALGSKQPCIRRQLSSSSVSTRPVSAAPMPNISP